MRPLKQTVAAPEWYTAVVSRSDPDALKASLRRIGETKAQLDAEELRAWLDLPLGQRLAHVLADCGAVPQLRDVRPDGRDTEAEAWARINAQLARLT